jgi:hypothetical protein
MFHSRAARNVRGYQAQQKLASSDPDILRLTPLVPQPLLFLGKRAEAAKLPFVDYRGFGGRRGTQGVHSRNTSQGRSVRRRC